MGSTRPAAVGTLAALAVALLLPALDAGAATIPPLPATPALPCTGVDDDPEPAEQGRVPASVYADGWTEPFTCNLDLLDHAGATGGFKVLRYEDPAGNVCLYHDSTLIFPLDLLTQATEGAGVVVTDAADPTDLRVTTTLTTPAMLSPHESLLLDEERGRLLAVAGTTATAPGVLDVYDLTADCRQPVLLSSTSNGLLGHESGLSPDGRTLYVTSPFFSTFAAVDLTDPAAPTTIYSAEHQSHGVRISPDGTRAYLSPVFGVGNGRSPFYSHPELADGDATGGIEILDVSAIQARAEDMTPTFVSELTWPEVSIPQVAIPFTRDGHPYLLEVDEFVNIFDGASWLSPSAGFEERTAGAARIIDIGDETAPVVVSNLRLEVHDPEVRTREGVLDDPGARSPGQGYAAHYCSLSSPVDPDVVACSMIVSGLRIFDVSDVDAPVEIAHFNAPGTPGTPPVNPDGAPYAMSAPAIDPATRTVFYSDAASGLYAVRVDEAVWPDGGRDDGGAAGAADPAVAAVSSPAGTLAATGPAVPGVVGVALLAAGALVGLLRRRVRAG